MKKIIYTLSIGVLFACGDKQVKITGDHNNHEHNQSIVLNKDQVKTNDYIIGKPSSRTFSKGIKTTGIVDLPPSNRHVVSTYLPGYAKKINVIVGDHVKKGQVLAIIEDPGVIELQEKYAKAESKKEYLEQEFQRLSQLFNENVVSKKEYLQAKSDFKSIQAEANSLKEQLLLINTSPSEVLNGNLSRSYPIYAPASGVISKVNITTGEWVGNNKSLLSLVDPEHIHLELQVFAKDIKDIKPGQQINFGLHGSANHPFKAHIYRIGAEVKEDRRVLVHAHPDSLLKNLTIGAYVDGTIHLSADSLLALPNTAVTSLGDETFALRIIEQNNNEYKLQRIPIRVFEQSEKFVAIDRKWENNQFLLNGVFDLIKEEGGFGGHSH